MAFLVTWCDITKLHEARLTLAPPKAGSDWVHGTHLRGLISTRLLDSCCNELQDITWYLYYSFKRFLRLDACRKFKIVFKHDSTQQRTRNKSSTRRRPPLWQPSSLHGLIILDSHDQFTLLFSIRWKGSEDVKFTLDEAPIQSPGFCPKQNIMYKLDMSVVFIVLYHRFPTRLTPLQFWVNSVRNTAEYWASS